MLFDKETAATTGQAARPEAVLGTGFWFDWNEQHYLMDAGSPVEVTGTGALKAWVNLVVRTKRDRYPIYPLDFGAPAQELIGRKYPKGYKLSELKRQFAESAAYCPAIREVDTMTYDGEEIHSTLTLVTDQGESKEVITVGT